MPLSRNEKEAIIKRLRIQCNRTDLFKIDPQRSLERSEQVKADVEEIVQKGLNGNISGWGDRCRAAREQRNYTYQEVAEMIGVSHKTIQSQENIKFATKVDPFYLEVFSLIYDQLPHAMLGIQGPLVCPFVTVENQYSGYCNVIINTLYLNHDLDKLEHLEVITKIAKLTEPKYRVLMRFLKDLSIFDTVYSTDPLLVPEANDNSWGKIEKVLREDQRGTVEYKLQFTFWEAVLVLKDLECRNSERLRLLAQMAIADSKVRGFLKNVMIDANYPRDPKSLRKYDVDSIIINTEEAGRQGKRTRSLSI